MSSSAQEPAPLQTRAQVARAFHDELTRLLDWLPRVLPADLHGSVREAKRTYGAVAMLSKSVVPPLWAERVFAPFADQIRDMDVGFFLAHDFTDAVNAARADLQETGNDADEVLQIINRARPLIGALSEDVQNEAMDAVYTLSMLADAFVRWDELRGA